MCKKEIIIDGSKFNNIDNFYVEIDNVLTKGLTWKTGHNLDAFNDLLRGGFGVHKYGEPIILIWENANKSKVDLGYNETIKRYENMLTKCHPANLENVRAWLEDAKHERGDTLFDIIIQIIKEHDHIEFILR